MSLLVQKFGGSSVGSVEKIQNVAARVKQRLGGDTKIVVVVSAMQGETDRLLSLAHALAPSPDPRETDQLLATGEQASAALLAMALQGLNIRARSMTGTQMQVITDGAFSRARIKRVGSHAVHEALNTCDVIVATGFQGVDAVGNLTTLGRGGSDTSAVALAAGLGAAECEIYTDVLGVYTADPNICEAAVKLDEISFDEMMEMASQGSKVLQIRSVELAMNHQVPLRVRSTFSDDPGTLVRAEDDDIERLVVRGISHNIKEVKITLRRVPDTPGIAAEIFSALAADGINVDVIVQNTSKEGTTDLSFTTELADKNKAEDIVRSVAKKIGVSDVEVDAAIAKISIVGVGMRSHPGVAAAMFESLRAAQVNIQMITTSEIKVTCVIAKDQVETAVNALHDTFDLAKKKRKAAVSKKPKHVARRGAS